MNNIFLCDIDGVLADTMSTWLNIYSQESNHHLTVEDITDWNIDSFVLPDWKEKIWEIFERRYLYDLVTPVPGAIEGVKKLQSLDWRVIFVTSPSNNEDPMRRFAWLKRWGFTNSMRDFIVARDKSLIQGRVILDDNYHNIIPGNAGRIGILFEQPWNRSNDCFFRAKDWRFVLAIVDDQELIERGKVDTTKTIERFRRLGLLENAS